MARKARCDQSPWIGISDIPLSRIPELNMAENWSHCAARIALCA